MGGWEVGGWGWGMDWAWRGSLNGSLRLEGMGFRIQEHFFNYLRLWVASVHMALEEDNAYMLC